MTTKKTLILALTLLTAGALATSCSNEDNISDGPQAQQPANGTITLTATLAPKGEAKGDSGGQTRSVDESGATAWVSGEKVAVYYQKDDDTYATATATVGEPNADGSAPITASLDDAKDGGTAKFVYPATLSDGAGGIDASMLGGQDGTMAGISANFDAATGEGTITFDGGWEASVCGTVTMTNRVLIGKFTPTYSGAAINGITSLIISDGTNMYTVAPSSGTFGTTGIYVAMLPVSDKKVSIWANTASTTYIFKKSVTLAAGKLYRSLAIPCGLPETVNLSSVTTTSGGATDVGGTPTLTLQDGQLVTGSLVRTTDAHKVKVTIADGATVTLNGATIDGKAEDTSGDFSSAWAGITCEGDATILLTGANTVTNFHSRYPAIFVPEGKTLTIGGSGSLTASDTWYDITGSGAAIGGGDGMACGNIAITGGTITANGGYSSAGIGGGQEASCGSITISGGSVTAAGDGGAGIGSGRFGGSGASCGDITISGTARVTATGGGNAAGIGSAGADEGNANTCGNISISGACTVIATGGGNGAGIGTGEMATCGSIRITGGTVTAQGGNHAAGIGTGCMATCGSIRITGGTVTAQGGGNAAGIGCGQGSHERKSECGAITIKDGGNFTSVTAIRGQGGITRPIGHSSYDSNYNTCGTITFGEKEIYTAGDYPGSYSIDGGGLNFEQTTTNLGAPDEDYTDNTWKLRR